MLDDGDSGKGLVQSSGGLSLLRLATAINIPSLSSLGKVIMWENLPLVKSSTSPTNTGGEGAGVPDGVRVGAGSTAGGHKHVPYCPVSSSLVVLNDDGDGDGQESHHTTGMSPYGRLMTFNQPITDNDLEAGLNVSIKGNDNGGARTILTAADTSEWWAPKKSYWRVGASLAIQVQTWWIQGILWIAKLRHYAAKLLRNQPSAEIVRVGRRTHKRVVKCEFCGWQRRPWHEKRVERPKLVCRIANLKIQMQCISIAQARTKMHKVCGASFASSWGGAFP